MKTIHERKFSVMKDETEFIKLLDDLVLKISRIIKEARSTK